MTEGQGPDEENAGGGSPPSPTNPSADMPNTSQSDVGPPSPAGAPPAAPSSVNTTQRSGDERRAILAQQLQQAATRGLRVESSTEFQAVLIEGQPVNHTLHAILTIFTCLIWGIVWAVIAATGGEKRHQLIVDEFGNVHWQELGRA